MTKARSIPLTLPARAVALAASLSVGACASLPHPPVAPQLDKAFVEVPAPPPPARVEIVPPKPPSDVTWVDGAWLWEGSRWKWNDGGWFAAPKGLRYADWQAKRRPDGTMLYANPQWVDGKGAPVAAPPRISPAPAIGGGTDEKKS